PTIFEESGAVSSVVVDGLNDNTLYYVRAYVIDNGVQTYSDNTSSFTTMEIAPTITLVDIDNITAASADVNVLLTGSNITKTGVEIDTDPLFSNPTQYEENGAVNTIAVDTLTAETTYYVRGYVVWNGQTIYSANTLNFTTAQASILPAELQGVEYLQTDGAQDIVIAEILFQNTDIYFNAHLVDTTGLAGWNDQNTNSFGTHNHGLYLGGVKTTNVFSDYIETEWHYITNQKPTLIYNQTTYTGGGFFYHNGTFDGFHLFKIAGFNGLTGKFKKYEVVSNGITYTFQPCYVKSGKTYTDNKGNICPAGTCGMYDVVNNVFYTNDGTGTFSKGADINI
ncbi:MAG: hypothetical protein J6S85_18525, partial [Methanobrevibacter sp.]|nr:hypothetical protein [Methanobrevibacter sp.]